MYVTEQVAMLFEPVGVQAVWAASVGRPLKPTDPAGVFEFELPVTVAVQVLVPPFQSMLDMLQPTPMVVGPVVAPDVVDVAVVVAIDVVVVAAVVVVVVVAVVVIVNEVVPCWVPTVAMT